jgi:beta-lactamase regulating signal transducer with metallopeptidase domain
MSAEFYTACERLLSATANGLYQGMLVAVLAGLSLRLLARTNAATRHAVWFGVLLFVTALIPAHLLLSRRPHSEIPAVTTRPAFSMMAIALAPSDAGNRAGSPVADAAFPDPQPDESDAGSIGGTPSSPGAGPQGEWAGGEIVSKDRPNALAAEKAWSRFIRPILKPLSWNLERAISLPHSFCLCVVSAWVLLAAVRGAQIAGRIGQVRRVKTTSRAPSQRLQTLFDRLRDSLKTRRNVRLRIASAHRTAVVLGFVHPVILLPAEMDQEANDGEVEHVLRHELAHVDRRDDWGNLVQQFIQAALFFHPAVWWISARLSLEREIACDDHVLEASGRPRAYALTLANVASRVHHCRHLLAPGVSSNNSQLQQRITMILNTHRDRSTRLARSWLGLFTTATALLAVLAIDAGPRLVLAQSASALPAASDPGNSPPPAAGADSTPAALPPDAPAADSGPRFKPSFGDNDNNDDATRIAPPPGPAAEPPPPPMLADAAIAGVSPVPAAVPMVAVAPVAGMSTEPPLPPSARRGKRNLSVEERLDRIERILEDIEAHGGVRSRHRSDDVTSGFAIKIRPDLVGVMPPDSNPDSELKHAADEARRASDDVRRAVEASQRAAEAGQRTAEQAMRDIERLKSKDFERMADNWRDAQSDGQRRAIEALRQARESLDRQRETLDRQIERLEQDQKRQNHQNKAPKGRSEDRPDGPEPEAPAAAEAK